MTTIKAITGEESPENYALAAAMAFEHIGNLFTFLDTRLGEFVMFDPDEKVKENVIREALRIGGLVCRVMVADSKKCACPHGQMRDLWGALVEEAVRRNIQPEAINE